VYWLLLPLIALNDGQIHTHTHTHKHIHTYWYLSGRGISPKQRTLPDNTQHAQETSMPPARFEPAIPECERPQTHTLYRAANGMGRTITYEINLKDLEKNKLWETKALILSKYLTYIKEANCKEKKLHL